MIGGGAARTYTSNSDGAGLYVKAADLGGGGDQNICNLAGLRDGRAVKAESAVVDD